MVGRRRPRLGERPVLAMLTTLALIAVPPGAAGRTGLTEQRQGPLTEHLAEEFVLTSPCSVANRPFLPRRHLDAKQFCENFSHDDRRPSILPSRERGNGTPEHEARNGYGGPLLI
jgi:hypothetical protein